MSSLTNLLRLGLARGWIEYRLQVQQGLLGVLLGPAILLLFLWFFRGRQVEGVSLALTMLPGFLGVQLAQEGLTGIANRLTLDREDGTLLRAKALPQGMWAYLLARAVVTILSTSLGLLLVLIPGYFIVPGLASLTGVGLVTLLWVLVLGFLAMAPVGAVIGATVKSPTAAVGLTLLPMAAMVAISGIFYTIKALPVWLQWIGQLFPLYWVGLGLRSAVMPATAAALELGSSWRPLETALVLAVWAGVGFLVAPGILRRMARRTSGSDMEAGRRRYTQRG
jgi:ABC-2 type transport system permease protein